ncbi:MAG: ATP-binding protein [Marinifilaceae bacterium]
MIEFYYTYLIMTSVNAVLSSPLILCILLLCITLLLIAACLHISNLKQKLQYARIQMLELQDCIDMLIKESYLNIFMYDSEKDKVYELKNGEFRKTDINFQHSIKLVHPEDREKYLHKYRNQVSISKEKTTINIRVFENELQRYCDYEYIFNPLQWDENGNVIRYIYSRRNETKQRETLRKQKEIIDNLNLSLHAANLLLWEYDMINNVGQINGASQLQFNLTDKEIFKHIHPDDMHYAERLHEIAERENHPIIIRIKFKGTAIYQPYEVYTQIRYDENSTPIALYGILRNITEITQFQQLLTEKIELLEAIKNHMPVGMMFYDKDGYFKDINLAMTESIGLNRQKMQEGKLNILNIGFIPSEIIENLRNGEAGTYNVTYKTIFNTLNQYIDTPQDMHKSFNVCCSPIHSINKEVLGYISICTDITKIEDDKLQIEELQRNLIMALDAGEMATWKYNCESKHIDMLHGVPLIEDHIYINDFCELMDGDSRTKFIESIESIEKQEMENTIATIRMVINNKQYWFTCILVGILVDSKVHHIVGIRKDITRDIRDQELLAKTNEELVHSHNELLKSENHLRFILNKIPIPIYIKDIISHKYLFINEEALRLYGVTSSDEFTKFKQRDDQLFLNEIDKQIVLTGEEYVASEQLTINGGLILDTFVKKTLIENGGLKQLLVTRMDLTEQRKAQITNRIFSISFPLLRAFTWEINTFDFVLKCGDFFIPDNQTYILRTIDSLEDYYKLIHKDDRNEIVKDFNYFLNSEKDKATMAFRIDIMNTGCYEWWEYRAIADKRTHKGTVYKYIHGIMVCIDDQKKTELRLHRSKERLARLNKQNELILNNTTSGLIFIDAEYKVQWSNVEKVFHKYGDAFYRTGHKCHSSFYRNSPCPNCPAALAIQSGQISYQEFAFKNNGVISITAIPVIHDKKLEGVVLKIDDITERKKLIDDLQKAKKKAEESDKLKMAFLANMSHEIRTPLNAIVGFSQILHECDDDDERNEYIRIINNNNELLLRLISDILDLSKIESGVIEMKLERFNIVEVFDEIFSVFSVNNTKPLVNFIAENEIRSCMITFDKKRLMQVLSNLLSNAYKYTTEGYITLKMKQEDNGIKILVKDTGKGIDTDKQVRVFGRFEKFDSFVQGTGLGLAISKGIMEALKGRIGFTSHKDVGSEFWIWIPCTSNSYIEYVKDSVTSNSTLLQDKKQKDMLEKQLKILIAEDNDSNYLLMQIYLKQHNLTRAVNGQEAIEKVLDNAYDVVLMDLTMPIMNGLEATSKIRTFNKTIPIYAITANAFDSDKQLAIDAGCTGFLSKPVKKVDIDNLLCDIQPN